MDLQARPWRSVLYIPGSKERALDKAASLPADAIIFDLEDAVAMEEKPRARELLAQQLNRKTDAPPHEQLSEREFQVFLKLAKGQTAGEIAEALSLSVKTVSTYRTRLMEKMCLNSNSDLTYYALKNGLIV